MIMKRGGTELHAIFSDGVSLTKLLIFFSLTRRSEISKCSRVFHFLVVLGQARFFEYSYYYHRIYTLLAAVIDLGQGHT